MWCLYLDHTNGNIDRNLFQPVLEVSDQNNQLIEPQDLRPREIDELTNVVEEGNSILAFVHTGKYQCQWVQFARNHRNQVHLVLLSTNPDQFAGQGALGYPDDYNVYCFCPCIGTELRPNDGNK